MASRVNNRKLAFANYDPICTHCGFGILAILDVAHIDGDRTNNDVSNLVILCPNCKKMLGKKLISAEVIVAMRDIAKIGSRSKPTKAVASATRKRNPLARDESSQTTKATDSAAKPELVFELGADGGSAGIYRTRDANGKWEYQVGGSGMYLDENDQESWRSGMNAPVATFEEALHSITGDFWVNLHPLEIHPEYRKTVWVELQRITSKPPHESLDYHNYEKALWQKLCYETN